MYLCWALSIFQTNQLRGVVDVACRQWRGEGITRLQASVAGCVAAAEEKIDVSGCVPSRLDSFIDLHTYTSCTTQVGGTLIWVLAGGSSLLVLYGHEQTRPCG
jgi:predicted alpha/beta hydrolase family esterase